MNKWTFVLKDKGTNNQGWWLKISNLDELSEYYKLENPTRYGQVLENYLQDKHNLSLTDAIIRYSENNNYTILQGIKSFELMVAEQQIDSLIKNGAIYINKVGGYHGAYKDEPEYDEIILDKIDFPIEQITKKQNKNKFNEYGWLSPSGEFYESKWGTHGSKAREICKLKGINDGSIDGRDTLSNLGWVLIHNPSDPNNKTKYIVSNIKPLTKKQKDFLFGYFTDVGMYIKANEFIEN